MRPEIVDYRERWPAAFEEFAAKVRAWFGPIVLRVDHIGSTSVPGLCAKDVLDVQVTVASLEDVALEAIDGLRRRAEIVCDHVPPGADVDPGQWAKRYFDTGDDRVHVHVRRAGAANQRYALLFRDYLRSHPDAAEAYGQLKRRLAAVCEDTGAYADAKDPVCDLIMQAAERWAEETNWDPER